MNTRVSVGEAKDNFTASPRERGLYTENGEIDREFIRREIAAGRMHPAMAMFGLWTDQPEWDDIGEGSSWNCRSGTNIPGT
ncbi:MAG: hypothetical protein H8D78_19580 [Chloroflexi bacterium]|nr:hypothetical protein [Chloroflexota bacterium]